MDAKTLLDVESAAAYLSIKRSLMYILIRNEIPSIKIGRCRRISVAALDEFVRRRTQEASEERQ